MSNSDKNIVVSPSTGSTDVKPSIQFTGAGNSTISMTVEDTNILNFESSDTSLFSVSHEEAEEDILVITNRYASETAKVKSDGTFAMGLLSGDAGSIGVGTTQPTVKLDVVGDVLVSGATSTASLTATGTVSAASFSPSAANNNIGLATVSSNTRNFYQDNLINSSTVSAFKLNSDGTKGLIIDNAPEKIHTVSLDAPYQIGKLTLDSTYDVKASITSPDYSALVFNGTGFISDDGTKVYITAYKSAGSTYDNFISQFDLSTAFDASTAGFGTEFYIGRSGPDGGISYSLCGFNTTGSKMYLYLKQGNQGSGEGIIEQYDLSTPWEVDTAVGISSVIQHLHDRSGQSFALKSDGTKAYTMGIHSNDIIEYDLDTPYVVKTARHRGVSADLGGDYRNFKWKPDGTRLFAESHAGTVHSWTLSSAWDLSTLSSSTSLDVSAKENDLRGIDFKSDGTELYIVGEQNDSVHRYTLSSGWDLSSASFTSTLDVGTLLNGGNQDSVGDGDLRGDNLGITTQKARNSASVGISTDGTKLFVGDHHFGYIAQWDLSTPYDITTGVSTTRSLSVNMKDNGSQFTFDSTGLNLYVTDSYYHRTQQYHLSSAWDLSTAETTIAYWSNLDSRQYTWDPKSLLWSNDGKEFAIYGTSNSGFLSYYKVVDAYDIRAAARHGGNSSVEWGMEEYTTGNLTASISYTNSGKNILKPSGSYGYAVVGLSSAYEPHTIEPDGSKFDLYGTQHYAFDISPDGRTLIVNIGSFYSTLEVNLKNPWDFSNWEVTQRVNDSESETSLIWKKMREQQTHDLKFSPDGRTLYQVHAGNRGQINAYTLEVPYRLRSIKHDYEKFINPDSIPNISIAPNTSVGMDVRSIDFNNEGTKFYLQCQATHDGYRHVHEVDLLRPWDITSMVYNGVHVKVTSSGNYGGIAFTRDGMKMYQASGDTTIHQWDLTSPWDLSTATVSSDSLDTRTINGNRYVKNIRLKPDGSKLFVSGGNDYFITSYNFTPAEVAFSASATIGGELRVGNDLVVGGEIRTSSVIDAKKISVGVATLTHGERLDNSIGLRASNKVSAPSLGPSKDISLSSFEVGGGRPPGGVVSLRDFAPGHDSTYRNCYYVKNDGTKLFAINDDDSHGRETLYSYNLATAHDLSTLEKEYTRATHQFGGDQGARSLRFKPDGTKMYIARWGTFGRTTQSGTIEQWDLSTAWDIRTATLSETFYTGNQHVGAVDFCFSSDGGKIYALMGQPNVESLEINEYTLPSAWDLGIVTHTAVMGKINSSDWNQYQHSIAIKSDGKTIFIFGQNTSTYNTNNWIRDIKLTTAWDLSTAIFGGKYHRNHALGSGFVHNKIIANAYGGFVTDDGMYLYHNNDNKGTIFQYPMTSAWDFETIPEIPGGTFTHTDATSQFNNAFWGNDGKSVIVSNTTTMAKYDLAIPYDLRTIDTSNNRTSVENTNYQKVPYYLGGSGVNPTQRMLSLDGTKLYSLYTNLGNDSASIVEYKLHQPWAIAGGMDITYTWTMGMNGHFINGSNHYFDSFNFSRDGKKFFLHEYQNPRFYQFELTEPWELASAVQHTYTAQYNQSDSTRGMAFSPDGTAYYFMDGSDNIYKMYLPDAYDINNRQYSKNERLNTTSADNNMMSPTVGAGSSAFYVIGTQNDNIYQYSMDADDFSDSTLINTFDISGEFPTPLAMDISDDGTEIYVVGDANAGIKLAQYTLSTAYNLATAGLTTEFTLAEKFPDTGGTNRFDHGLDIQIVDSGKTLYINNYQRDQIDRFTLTTPNDLSTITFATDKIDALRAEYSRRWSYRFQWTNDGTALYTVTDATYQNLIKYNASTAWDIDTLTIQRPTGMKTSGALQNSGGEGANSDYRYTSQFEFDADGLTIYALNYLTHVNINYRKSANKTSIVQYNLGKPYDISTIGFTTAFPISAEMNDERSAFLFNPDRQSFYHIGLNVNTYEKGWDEYSLTGDKNNPLTFSSNTIFGAKAEFDNGIEVIKGAKLSSVGIGTTELATKDVSLDVYGGSDIDAIRNDFDLKHAHLPYSKVLAENAFDFIGSRRQYKSYQEPAGGQYEIQQLTDIGISTDGKNLYLLQGHYLYEQDANIYQFELTTPFKINTAVWPAKNTFSLGDDDNLSSTFGTNVYNMEIPNSDFVGVRHPTSFVWKPDGTKLIVAGYYGSDQGNGTIHSDGRNAGNKIITYSLDTAWDLSTINVGLTTFRYTEDFRFGNSSQQYLNRPLGMSFNDDGSRMYFADYQRVFQVDLTSDYVVGSANTSTFVRAERNLSYHKSIQWKPGGEVAFSFTEYGITASVQPEPYRVDQDSFNRYVKNYLTTAIFPTGNNDYADTLSPQKCIFSADGKYLYYLDQFRGYVYGTELRTAWDPSTPVTDFFSDPDDNTQMGYDFRLTATADNIMPHDRVDLGQNDENWWISPDGLKLFMLYSGYILQAELNEPWNFRDIKGGGSPAGGLIMPQSVKRFRISPKSKPAKYSDSNNDSANITQFQFSSDGLNFYTFEENARLIHHYECEIPYDLGSLVKKSQFDQFKYLGNVSKPYFSIKDDGTRIYLFIEQDVIHQFDLTVPYDLNSAVKHDWLLPLSTTGYTVETSTDNTETRVTSFSYNNDGTKMFGVDYFRDAVYEWELSTPYKISTATRTDTTPFDISAKSGDATHLRFKPDGTEMFILDDSDDKIYQYTLSTGYDLTTASFTREWTVASLSDAKSFTFNGDGTKLYVNNNSHIYQFTLGAAYNISSVSFDSKEFEFSNRLNDGNGHQTNISDWEVTSIRSIQFNSDGTALYYAANYHYGSIVKINLRVAYDISTAFFSRGNDVGDNVGRDTVTSYFNYGYFIDRNQTFEDFFIHPDEDKFNFLYATMAGTNTGEEYYQHIIQIDLTTAGNLYSAKQNKNVRAFRGQVVNDTIARHRSPFFSPDGTKLYADTESYHIVQYSLSTPWDIQTAEYTGFWSYHAYVASLQTLSAPVFKPDMSTMWFKHRTHEIIKVDLTTAKPLYITKDTKISGDIEHKGILDVKGTAKIRNSEIEYLTTGNDTRNTSKSEISLKVKNTLEVDRIADENSNEYGPDFSIKGNLFTKYGSISRRDREFATQVGVATEVGAAWNSIYPSTGLYGGVGFTNNGQYLYYTTFDQFNNIVVQVELEKPYYIDNANFKNKTAFSFGQIEGNVPEKGTFRRADNNGDIVTAFYIDPTGEYIWAATDGSGSGTNLNVGIGTSGIVNQYRMTTPNDLSTIGWSTSINVFGTIPRINDIYVGDSGTKLYLSSKWTSAGLGDPANVIYQYDMSTAYDVSTASIGSTYGSTRTTTIPYYFRSIGLSTGGDKLYYVNAEAQFETVPLSTPWDLSSADRTGISTFRHRYKVRGGSQADAFAWSHDGRHIAFGTKETLGHIEIVDTKEPWTLGKPGLYGGSADYAYSDLKKSDSWVNTREIVGSFNLDSGAINSNPFRIRFDRSGKRAILLYSNTSSNHDFFTVTFEEPYNLGTLRLDCHVDPVNYGIFRVTNNSYITDFDVTPDGRRVFVITNNGNDDNHIEFFDLSIPWDVSSIKSQVGVSTSNYYWFPHQDASNNKLDPQLLEFTPDGMYFFTSGVTVDKAMFKYKMDRPYEINTAQPVTEHLFIFKESSDDAVGMFMSRDGTKVYTITNASVVHRYDIPGESRYNLNKAVYGGNTTSLSSNDSAMQGIYFKDDGTKMYTVGITNDNVYEYTLSTAWDVTTKGSATTFDVSGETTEPTDIEFSRDGSLMFVSSQTNVSGGEQELISYKLSTPWDISTATKHIKTPVGYHSVNFSRFDSFSFSNDGYQLVLLDGRHNPSRCHSVELEKPYQIDAVKTQRSSRSFDAYGSYNQGFIHRIRAIQFSEKGDKLYCIDNYNTTYGGNIWTWTLSEPFSIDNPYWDGVLRTTDTGIYSACFSPDGLTLYIDRNQAGYMSKVKLRQPYQLHDATVGADFTSPISYVTPYATEFFRITMASDGDSIIVPVGYSDSDGLQKITINDVKTLDIVKPVDIKAKLNVEGSLNAGGLTINSDRIHISPGIGSTASLGIMYTNSEGLVKPGSNPLAKLIFSAPPASTAAGLAYTTYAVPHKFGDTESGGTNRSLDGEYYGGGVLAPNGRIYFYQPQGRHALEITPETGTTKNIAMGDRDYMVTLGSFMYDRVMAPTGEVWAAPYDCINWTLVNDPFSRRNRIVGLGTNLNSTAAYASINLTRQGTLVCMPYSETRVMEIDPITEEVKLYGNLTAGNGKCHSSVLGPDGNVYGIPFSQTEIIEFNPVTKAVTTHSSQSGSNKWRGGVLAPNGFIYFVPYASAGSNTTIGKFDPVTKNFSSFGTISGSTKYIGGTLAPNGRIYCASFDADNILEIDPVTDTFQTFATSAVSGIRYFGSVLGLDNKIYAPPYDGMNEGLVITPPNVGIQTSLYTPADDWIYSLYVNKAI